MTQSFDEVSKIIGSSDLFRSMENSNRVALIALCVDVFKLGEKSKQAEIDELRKRIDDLEKNKLCIQNLVKKPNIAESKLNKIAIQAQKKLETFGSALLFKDTVQNILKGDSHES